MNSNKMRIGESRAARPSNPFFRGFIQGTASLLDIFGAGARRREPGTLENDAQELRGDVEQIAQDFQVVLSNIASTTRK